MWESFLKNTPYSSVHSLVINSVLHIQVDFELIYDFAD